MAAKRPQEDDSSHDPPYKRPHLESSETSCRFKYRPWTLSEISESLPPLPKPADPQLEKQAFIHIGSSQNENYEHLEWIGDAWLQSIATEFISTTFQSSGLKVGRLSQLREQLVKNKTLAGYLCSYGLDKRAVVDDAMRQAQQRKAKDQNRTKESLSTMEKVHGDMFEAYVGAIIRSDPENGLQIVTDWLKALWGREIKDELRKMNHNREKHAQYTLIAANAPKQPPSEASASTSTPSQQAPVKNKPASNSNINAKDILNQAILCPGVKVEYRDMPSKSLKDKEGYELFAIGVYFNGWGVKDELLAVGKARKKSEAGMRAAEHALENKKMLKKYGAKKQAFLKARDEREVAEGAGT
ncbi:ribonuclease III domain-containing protein [Sarocladium implicatum]|nr:ribonuclease III domain-containing protein [Sarocladium implicatum]